MTYTVKGNTEELVQRFMSEYVDAFFIANEMLHDPDKAQDFDELDPDTFMAICCEIMDDDPDAVNLAKQEGSPFFDFYNAVQYDILDPHSFEHEEDDEESEEEVKKLAGALFENYPDAFDTAIEIYKAYANDGYFERVHCEPEVFQATCYKIIKGDPEALEAAYVRSTPFREFYMECLVKEWK